MNSLPPFKQINPGPLRWFLILATILSLYASSNPIGATNREPQTLPPDHPPGVVPSPRSGSHVYFPLISSTEVRSGNATPAPAKVDEPELIVAATPTTAPSRTPPLLPHVATVEPTATGTSERGSAGIPPTPTVESDTAQCIRTLDNANTIEQQRIVEENLDCLIPFVDLLQAAPENNLDTFYALIASPIATNDLWTVVFNRARLGEFKFGASTVEELWRNLPLAIAGCVGSYRCSDWGVYVLPHLTRGDFYRCPDVDKGSTDDLINSVPYGNYACTEETATALKANIDVHLINQLIEMGAMLEHELSRRNVMRVLGRMAESAENSQPYLLMMQTLADEVKSLLINRLEQDRSAGVLHDVIWILDSFYFPFFAAQSHLERISADSDFESALRFRAIAAISRLIDEKSDVDEMDYRFLANSLQSDDKWVRAQAAFSFQLLEDTVNDEKERRQISALLLNAYEQETELSTKISLASAIDSYDGTNRRDELQEAYESEHLPAHLSWQHIAVRSGLPAAELPAILWLMRHTESAFFDTLGPNFATPVQNDMTSSMTLLLFASRDEYREYMNAFVGYGAEAGGLYLEGKGMLYTYQRRPEESAYRVEHLIQHEFTHYLAGRYLFPGIWDEPGYHTEPKGWADEGIAELFGLTTHDETGSYVHQQSPVHLQEICAKDSYGALTALLSRRAGYDQPGVFDYAHSWALIYYLLTEQRDTARQIYSTFRDDTYRRANFSTITGSSVAQLEIGWHSSIDRWCQSDSVGAAATTYQVLPEYVRVVGNPMGPLPPREDIRNRQNQIIRLVDTSS